MGAKFSHHARDRSAPHECSPESCHFKVSHVDGSIKTIVRGHLEINNRSLGFSYVENGTVLKLDWPFNVIRNYGRTTEFLFMIEVGRKSSTGDGYFFFKCRQASGVNDCLERHLKLYLETITRRKKFRNSSSSSSRHDHSHRHRSNGFRDKEPSAPIDSSSSFSDFAPSDADTSYASSQPDSGVESQLMIGAPSGGYVVPVFQHQDSFGEVDQLEDQEHDYVNQDPSSRPGVDGDVPLGWYINVKVEESVPARPVRSGTSSGVEYSTVITDLPNCQKLGNDYSNLPRLETLPPAL